MGTHTSLKGTQSEVQTGAGAEMGGNRAQVSESGQWSIFILGLGSVISSLLKCSCVGLGCFNDFCTVITKIIGNFLDTQDCQEKLHKSSCLLGKNRNHFLLPLS